MGRAIGIFLAIAVVLGIVSLYTRSTAILSSSDQLLDDANELLSKLHGIHDAAGAQAALSDITKLIAKLKAEEVEIVKKAEAIDRKGGVTKMTVETFKRKGAEYQALMRKVGSEIQRVAMIPNLPPNFLSSIRAAAEGSTSMAQAAPPVVPQQSPESPAPATSVASQPQFGPNMPGDAAAGSAAQHRPGGNSGSDLLSRDELVARYGKDKVVKVLIVNQFDIVAQLDQVATAISNAAPEVLSCDLKGGEVTVAPVNNLDAFCKGIDFAEVLGRDEAEATVTIKVDPTKVAAAASRRVNPTVERVGGPDGDDANKELEAEMLRRAADRSGLPSPKDSDYHKKLCDMMVDPAQWTLKDRAIDALLQISPEEITDKAVRKQIARNFREMAKNETHGAAEGKAIRGLALYGGKFSVPILIDLLERRNGPAPSELFEALGMYPDPQGADAVTRQLGNVFNHEAAVGALRAMGSAAEDELQKAAPSNNPKISLAAVQLLGEVGTQKSLSLLAKAAKSTNQDVADAAKESRNAIRERSPKPMAVGK